MPIKSFTLDGLTVYMCGSLVMSVARYWTYFYKLRDILFDCGPPKLASKIVNAVGEVSAVFVTHHHEDHTGAAHRFNRVYAPVKSLDVLKRPPKTPLYRRVILGKPRPLDATPVKDGDVVLGVKVIETPGHSFDHVCYLVDDYLFSGDLIHSPGHVTAMKGERCLQTMDSLRRVLRLDWSYALGGTGIYSREDAERYLDYLEALRERVRELYLEGRSIKEIVRMVFPNPSRRAILLEIVSGGEWSRENMVRSLISDWSMRSDN